MQDEGCALAGFALDLGPAAVQLDQGLDQSQADARSAPLAPDEPVEDVGLKVIGDAPAGVLDPDTDLRCRGPGGQGHCPALRDGTGGVIQQMIKGLTNPLGIGTDGPQTVGAVDHQACPARLDPGPDAPGSGVQQIAHPHISELQLHLAGVDLGHVQHIVDRAGQLAGGDAYGTGMLAAALGQVGLHLQQFRIADDGGQGCAQLIGDAAHELALQRRRFLQRLGLGGQRLFQSAPGGHVGEGHQGRAVGQGAGQPGSDPAVGGLALAGDRHPAFGIRVGDPRLQPQPQGRIGHGRLAQGRDRVEIPGRGQGLTRHAPESVEGLIVQTQPPVRAEHGDGVIELVEGRGLDLDLGIEPAAQLQLIRDIREQQQDPAQRMGLAHDPQRPAVGQ